jgi:hypothetical protein
VTHVSQWFLRIASALGASAQRVYSSTIEASRGAKTEGVIHLEEHRVLDNVLHMWRGSEYIRLKNQPSTKIQTSSGLTPKVEAHVAFGKRASV